MHNVLKGFSLKGVYTTVPTWTWIDWVGIWPVAEFFTTKSLVGETCPVDSIFCKSWFGELQREEPDKSLACGPQDENKLSLLIISTSPRELSPNSSTGAGPSITFVLELQVDPRKPQSEMICRCPAWPPRPVQSPPGALGISSRGASIWGFPAARFTGGCWVEVSTLVVLPRNLCKRKTTRLELARQTQHRRLRHWRHALLCDESRYLLQRASGRVRMRREAGQRFQEDCVLPTVAHGGGISACLGCHPLWWPNQSCDLGEKHHWWHLQAAAGNRNASLCQETLQQKLSVPTWQCSRSRSPSLEWFPARCRSWAQQLPWPHYSPDLNYIEHAWDALDHAIRQRERSNQLIWVNWLMLSPRNGMHTARDTWTSYLSPSSDASLLSSRHEGDIPVTKCVSPDWTFWGTDSLENDLLWRLGLWYWHALQVQIYHFLHYFEMSRHDIKFSAVRVLQIWFELW